MRNSRFTILFRIISTSNFFGCLGPRVTGWDCVRPNKPHPHYGSMSIAGVLAVSIWFSLAFAMAQTKTPSTAAVPQFEDLSKQVGLTASHISTAEQHYIIESMSGGIALFDCDGDGKLDIFVTGFGGSALYRGLGNCKFEDVTDKAGVRGSGFMTGAAWADYDRDGYVDLFVARYVHLDMNKLPEFGSNEKFWRSAVHGAWKAKATCFFETAAMVRSKRSPRKLGLTIPGTATGSGACGAITITTAGPICTWPTMPAPIFSTTTSTMGPSKKSAF